MSDVSTRDRELMAALAAAEKRLSEQLIANQKATHDEINLMRQHVVVSLDSLVGHVRRTETIAEWIKGQWLKFSR